MIGKVLHMLTSVVVYVCLATVIAEGILLAYYSKTWQLDRTKLLRMLAIAQGADLESLVGQGGSQHEEPSTEQVSYNQVLDSQAVKTRNLELREQSLRSGVQQLQTEERRLTEEKSRVQKMREGFQGELFAMQKGSAATGREDVRLTFEALKPKQAKELMIRMMEKELDDVVMLMEAMPEGKRAKIIAEFKTPPEVEQIGEVLRRIRQGLPTSKMADNSLKQLEQPKGAGP